MSKLNPKKFLLLCKKESVLLLCHENADLDSFCSAAMVQRYLRKNKIKSTIGVPLHINEQAQNFAFSNRISFQVNPALEEFSLVILFDLNEFAQLGKLGSKLKQLMKSKTINVLVFDHHVVEKESIARGANAIIGEDCVSTTEVIYNLLDKPSDKALCFWNCIGIVEDTGHFLVGNAASFASFSECLKFSGRTYSEVLSFAKHKAPEGERIAFLKAAQRAEITKIGEAVVVTSELSFYQGAAATKLLDFGAHISIVCGKEKGELSVLSARVEAEFRDKYKFNLVKDLLLPLKEKLGGDVGGHSCAAQWKGNAEPKEVIVECVNILKKKI